MQGDFREFSMEVFKRPDEQFLPFVRLSDGFKGLHTRVLITTTESLHLPVKSSIVLGTAQI